jgi:hypothetical protein
MYGLETIKYPLNLVFRRGLLHSISERSMDIADAFMNKINRKTSILKAKTNIRLSNRHSNRNDEIQNISTFNSTSSNSIFSSNSIKNDYNYNNNNNNTNNYSNGKIDMNMVSSSYMNNNTITNINRDGGMGEFDVIYTETALGARLEEKQYLQETVSVVTYLEPTGQSKKLGVKIGCIITGINNEKFISHAHTVATLKHSKRPITVKFKMT